MRRGAKQATPQLRVIGGQWRGRKLQFPPTPLPTDDPELGGSLFRAAPHAGSCFSGC